MNFLKLIALLFLICFIVLFLLKKSNQEEKKPGLEFRVLQLHLPETPKDGQD